jgi:hypothetical protein
MDRIIEFTKVVSGHSASDIEDSINECIKNTTDGWCLDIKIIPLNSTTTLGYLAWLFFERVRSSEFILG